MPLLVTVTRQNVGWEVSVENRTDRAVAAAHIVIEDYILPLGEVPARETRTVKVTRDKGQPLADFVGLHGAGFGQAVSARQRMFGGSGSGRLDDLPNGTVAASFLSQTRRGVESTRQFIAPPGLDLSSIKDHGNAVLLAWSSDYAPVKSMRQFSPRRSHQNTLWRVPVMVR